jgi:hypothetical protein
MEGAQETVAGPMGARGTREGHVPALLIQPDCSVRSTVVVRNPQSAPFKELPFLRESRRLKIALGSTFDFLLLKAESCLECSSPLPANRLTKLPPPAWIVPRVAGTSLGNLVKQQIEKNRLSLSSRRSDRCRCIVLIDPGQQYGVLDCRR